MTQNRSCLLLALLLFASPVYAQHGVTSEGTDFWLGFMPNSFSLGCCPPQNVTLYIGSGTDNEVYVDAYGGSNPPAEHYHATMTPNSVWSFSPTSEAAWETINPAEQPNYKAIHVYSTKPCVVYGYQFTGANTSSTDSYLGIPTPALGTEYYTSCYYDDHYSLGPSNPLAGQFLIISPYDSNKVTIGPVKSNTRADVAATTTLHNKGDIWSITLMKGQTYLVQSTGLGYGDQDLTGTHIVSSKPIALLSGHQLVSIPIGELAESNGSKDEIMEMIPPVAEWGTQYYDMPTATRTVCGDLVRVIAGEDNEEISAVSAKQVLTGTLAKAGDFYDFEQVVDPTVFTSNSKKKFLAVQMAYSQGYLGDPGLSDPFSIVLTPREQFQKKMLFRSPDRAGATGFVHYGTFICRSDSLPKIQLNGKPIGTYDSVGQSPIPGTNPPMSARIIRFASTSTTYTATCGAPFGCYLYGWNQLESYGHPASMALGISSSDTLAPIATTRDTVTYRLCLADARPNDSKIAAVSLIDSSYNFEIVYDKPDPFADSIVLAHLCLSLKVQSVDRDGYAALWVTDRAGNDTVYKFYHKAMPKGVLIATPTTHDFGTVDTGMSESFAFTVTNIGNAPDTISTLTKKDSLGSFLFSANPAVPTVLAPNDSIILTVTFAPHVAGDLTGSIEVAEADGTTSDIVTFSGIGKLPVQPPNDVGSGENLRGVQFRIIPNPSHGESVCIVTLDRSDAFRLIAVDALGRVVFLQNLGVMNAGEHRIDWPAASLPDGTYFLRLLSSSGSCSARVVIAR